MSTLISTIPDTLIKALQEQIKRELEAHFFYRQLAAYCQHENFPNLAQWMEDHASEEYEHAQKLIRLLADNRVLIQYPTIEVKLHKIRSVAECLQLAYHAEQEVTSHILALSAKAQEAGFKEAEILLDWFITEQREEEYVTWSMWDKLKKLDGNSALLTLFDQHLSSHKETVKD